MVIGTINSDFHAAVTNGTSDMKFPLGLSSSARNGFYMKQVFILLSEKSRVTVEKIQCIAFFITNHIIRVSAVMWVDLFGESVCDEMFK